MKGHFTQAGNTALPTREGSIAALQDLQDKLATMRNREAQVDALHRLYNDRLETVRTAPLRQRSSSTCRL